MEGDGAAPSGDTCAAKLGEMWQLNRQFAARGATLRIALLNNAAIVRLKQQEWDAAAVLCARALHVAPTAKALCPPRRKLTQNTSGTGCHGQKQFCHQHYSPKKQ